MRLAFVINDLSGGGAEKALKLLAEYITGQGVEASVVTLQAGNDGYSLEGRVERITLRSAALNRGAGKLLGMPLQAAELARIVRKKKADLCVSFLARSNVIHVMSHWFGNNRPALLTEQVSTHDHYSGVSLSDRAMRTLIAQFYPRANAVLPSSEGLIPGLSAFGVPAERMAVVPNPVALDEIRRLAGEPIDWPFNDGIPTAITVGRLADQKDQGTLLRAFAISRKEVESRLVIVGQGPLRQSLEGLARDLGIAQSVFFAGWQPNPFAWMARADLFVLTSRYEGFGNVIVEAMACGLPVISTDCPSGPREILGSGAAGMLVPVGDADALASRMTHLLADQSARREFSEKAAQRAPDFDINVIGPRYLELLRTYVYSNSSN